MYALYQMTEVTFSDLLPYLELYDEPDDDYSQYEPAQNIQIYVNDGAEVVEVATLEVMDGWCKFYNIGGGHCGTANINKIVYGNSRINSVISEIVICHQKTVAVRMTMKTLSVVATENGKPICF